MCGGGGGVCGGRGASFYRATSQLRHFIEISRFQFKNSKC